MQRITVSAFIARAMAGDAMALALYSRGLLYPDADIFCDGDDYLIV